MNLADFAASNGDFMVGLSGAKSRIDVARDEYERALETNAEHFVYDVAHGRPGQIARVVGEHKLTLAGELLDNISRDDLFEVIQRAMRGDDVEEKARALVGDAAKKFAEAITEWVE